MVAAAKAALDNGQTKYTPSAGLLPLRKAICEKFEKDNGLKQDGILTPEDQEVLFGL